jgi:hypothetical protein
MGGMGMGGMGGMGMGGMGGMGMGGMGGMGGGMFAVSPEREPAPRPLSTPATVNTGGSTSRVCPNISPSTVGAAGAPNDFSLLIDLITNTVAVKTWADNGGTGTVSRYDRMLVISQTQEVHAQVEQLLAELRARRLATPTLSVELHWLWLDAKQRDKLLAGQAKPSAGELSLAVDPERLRQVAREAPGFYGRLACPSGIGTAIAAGDRREIIQNALPAAGVGAIGYQPVISVPNVGVTAEVRPTFVPGTKTATLDVTSIITRWDPSRKPAIVGAAWPAKEQVLAWNSLPATPTQPVVPSVRTVSTQGGSSSCPVDLPVMPTQQMGTTLHVPLGKPVVVGAMTFAAADDAGLGAAGENPVQVYLIATTSMVRE